MLDGTTERAEYSALSAFSASVLMKHFTQLMTINLSHSKTVIIVAGPTAVGKTALSLLLAQHFKTAIISADSRQCFKEMSIGTAKPSQEELAQAKHYFINSHSVNDEVNAGVYEQYALHACDEIFTQNNVAIMVGGTGLYIKAFCEGIDIMPTIPSEIRTYIINQYQVNGLEWLQQELQTKDPIFWETAEKQNPQRLMRALEVFETTGKSITNYRSNTAVERPFNIIKIGLEMPREQLVQNINLRVDAMMQAGLLDEVESLEKVQHLNALQTVGYKELFAHLQGSCDLATAINQIKINTRQYAKRQMTWFKKDDEIYWLTNNKTLQTEIIILLAQMGLA
ncbi:tRNA (adenosine(37)-N6)-dimethylallyltransferase MiaA [Parasediminibacterium paludis]|uniref:tRNA dimethylallyltransferase n=1 Tax=Parasediminibacterium paludis TaxID=908966 RepID=A0ABV8PW80_9BACT